MIESRSSYPPLSEHGRHRDVLRGPLELTSQCELVKVLRARFAPFDRLSGWYAGTGFRPYGLPQTAPGQRRRPLARQERRRAGPEWYGSRVRRQLIRVSVTVICAFPLAVVAPASAAEPGARVARVSHCRLVNFNDGAYAIDISATNTSCREARRLASSPWSGRSGVHHRDGYTCRQAGAGEGFIATRCKKGQRRVYWKNVA